MAEGAMESMLASIGTYFTQAMTWMGDVLETVVSNPALLILVIAMPVISFAIGIFQRLVRS